MNKALVNLVAEQIIADLSSVIKDVYSMKNDEDNQGYDNKFAALHNLDQANEKLEALASKD